MKDYAACLQHHLPHRPNRRISDARHCQWAVQSTICNANMQSVTRRTKQLMDHSVHEPYSWAKNNGSIQFAGQGRGVYASKASGGTFLQSLSRLKSNEKHRQSHLWTGHANLRHGEVPHCLKMHFDGVSHEGGFHGWRSHRPPSPRREWNIK